MPGPCVICGLTDYPLSFGGPTICPSCDCGDFGPVKIERQRKEIESQRAENERLKEHLATNDRVLDHTSKELAKDSNLVNELSAEVERLTAERANRYWEGRYRDEKADNERLRAAISYVRMRSAHACEVLNEFDNTRAALEQKP
jgi:uncharacterized Zn finger protein (UPF0148 family)